MTTYETVTASALRVGDTIKLDDGDFTITSIGAGVHSVTIYFNNDEQDYVNRFKDELVERVVTPSPVAAPTSANGVTVADVLAMIQHDIDRYDYQWRAYADKTARELSTAFLMLKNRVLAAQPATATPAVGTEADGAGANDDPRQLVRCGDIKRGDHVLNLDGFWNEVEKVETLGNRIFVSVINHHTPYNWHVDEKHYTIQSANYTSVADPRQPASVTAAVAQPVVTKPAPLGTPKDDGIEQELAQQGLRRAGSHESGWYVYTSYGKVWATDLPVDAHADTRQPDPSAAPVTVATKKPVKLSGHAITILDFLNQGCVIYKRSSGGFYMRTPDMAAWTVVKSTLRKLEKEGLVANNKITEAGEAALATR